MGKSYNHISRDERVAIGIMLRDGKSLSDISRALGRNKGTISREIKRNASPKQNFYTMPWAQLKAEQRSWRAHKRTRLKNEQIVLYVRSKLKEGWSPEQISGRIGLDCPGLSISHEAIYQYVYSFARKRSVDYIYRRGDAKSLVFILGVSTPEDGKREWEEGAANPRL
jgi:IS30 family transposase